MTYMHNRRGSVLLMAIGMLTILAILASTFLVISNLDSEETESLSVRACADPIIDGLLSKAVAQIGFDRAVTSNGPYGAMLASDSGFVTFMDYPHAYTSAENTDHWLSSTYVPGEGISGQLTNIDDPANSAAACTGRPFAENGVYPDGQSGEYVDTTGDGVPDARLFDTKIIGPLTSDPNTYWAGVRIEDLGARMCVNTAAGWNSTEGQYDRPSGSGPEMVDLRTFLDNRSGTMAPVQLYPLLHAGDTTSGAKGRVGDASPPSNGTADNPAPASTRGYSRYCGSSLLAPGKPTGGTGGYDPFGIGEEVFFLNGNKYLDNMAQFGGRINQIISPLCDIARNSTPLLDNIRRQLTTMNCVSSLVRWPNAGITEPLVLNTVQSAADCQLVYDRMKLMLEATGMGTSGSARARMAAHFAANLWAYCSNTKPVGATSDAVDEPWAFTPQDGGGFTVFGLRQGMVITKVFARHIANTKFDANDTTMSKDDSAWGFAVELSNPSANTVVVSQYELEIKSDGNTVVVPVWTVGGKGLAAPASTDLTPKKRVVYGCAFGAGRADKTTATLFGAAVAGGTTWYQDNKLNFLAGAPKLSITLYKNVNGQRVPADYVSVGTDGTSDLEYNTNLRLTDIRGDYPGKKGPTVTGDTCIHIRRDDRLKTGSPVYRPARYNMAIYSVSTATSGTLLGQATNITEGALTRQSTYGAVGGATGGRSAIYSPGIYRPRDINVAASGTARESMPAADYFLPSIADLCNIYLAGPIRDGTDRPFTTEILRTDLSNAFADRLDIGRMPTAKLSAAVTSMADAAFNAATAKYPDVPPGYMFHEFFTRTPGHQARTNERKRLYGMININTLALPQNATFDCAAWWLPWPTSTASGSVSTNSGNRLGLGLGSLTYARDAAISAIRQYRDQIGRAASMGITGLRSATGSNITGFMTPGEVGIPLAKYVDTLLTASSAEFEKDSDYVRARNCLFGYISDCLTTRSDMFACYVTVQYGRNAAGKRWRYVAVIDRSNVIGPTDKAAVLLVSQMR